MNNNNMDDTINEEFEDLIYDLSDKEFWAYVGSWKDASSIIDDMKMWDTEEKANEIFKLKEIIADRNKKLFRYSLFDETGDLNIIETDCPSQIFIEEIGFYKGDPKTEADGSNTEDFAQWLRNKGYIANLVYNNIDEEVYF